MKLGFSDGRVDRRCTRGVPSRCFCHVQRNTGLPESKYVFYVAGLLSSLSLLLEEKSRRSGAWLLVAWVDFGSHDSHHKHLLQRAELALYVLPRAMDSLFLILRDKQWVPSIRHGEMLLFGAAMAFLMYFHEKEKESLGNLLRQGLETVMA